MEIAMAKSEGILGPLTKVEVVISPESTKTVSCVYSQEVLNDEGITEVTELMFVLDQDSDVSDHDPLVSSIHQNTFTSVEE